MYATPVCPTDPSHGRLLDMPSERHAWYCPHRGHEVAGTSPWFTTDLAHAARSGHDTVPPAASRAQSPRRERGRRSVGA